MEDSLPRKLVAVLYADVAGYSRLTGEDEDATHRILRDYLDLITRTVRDHRGQVMHYAGDAVLAKFDAVIDAMSSAVRIQNELGIRNENLAEERKVQFRIGVNSGDVIEDREDIYGDGVNVAARLETLAEPGGICISDAVRTAVGNKLDLVFEDMGAQLVKNIASPVHTYRVKLKASLSAETAEPSLANKRAIAVLSFENMSDDAEQEYFADGIAEDIITSLSKLSQLLVIARNSSFTYKGRAVKVQEIGDELGVGYVIEGSVRKSGNKVRITSQLIDCGTGGHLWAERFDRDLTDIFAVQDEVTEAIVAAMAVQLTADQRERLKATGTKNLKAYDFFLRGREQYRLLSKEGADQAEILLKRSIDLDPGYATAYAYLVFNHLLYYVNRWKNAVDQPLEYAHELAQKAVALDDTDPYAHLSLGKTHMWKRQHDQAIVDHEKSIALDPNFAVAYAGLGLTLHYAGRSEEAIGLINRGMRLDPHYPDVRLLWLAQPYFQLGRYGQAIDLLTRHLDSKPNTIISHVLLAASYGYLGGRQKAGAEWQEALRINPDYSLEQVRHVLPYGDPADFEKIVDGLRKADLIA